jgi:NADH-quinone oxidoreductase subunit C
MHERRPIGELVVERFGAVAHEGDAPVVLRVPAALLPDVAAFMRDDADLRFELLYSVSAVHYEERFETVYHVFSLTRRELAVLKCDARLEDPVVPTVSDVWPAALWHERECFDLMGIRFEGHPDLRHLLVTEETVAEVGYLLRKDRPIRSIEEARARGD